MSVEIVDPAWEIASVIRKLVAHPASNEQTWTVFQRAAGANISASEHWELMAALNSRLLRLDVLVNTVEDKELDSAQRARIVQAVNTFANVLSPSQQVQTWTHTLQHHLKADDGLQLMWFSIIAKRYQPLRRVTDDERAELIAKIDETLTALETGQDIPRWAKLPLSEGLRRLRFMLQHLIFFGCESAIDLLLQIYSKASAIEATVMGAANAANAPGSGGPTFLTLLNCVVLAASIFWLPDQATSAFERYQGWYLKAVVENPRLPKPKTLLLAAPTKPADEPHEPETPNNAAIEPTPPRETANVDDRAQP
jgi:hypothetical protein